MDLNFSLGTEVRITKGAYARQTGVIDSHIFGPSFDFPDDSTFGYGVQLDDGNWVLVRHDQVRLKFRKSADRDDT
ncbi:MAG: hypothetical protein BZY75_01110 [SAR202 cluster bacterium Io17-Chloro-G7]|nr:MAG: hypothetical protein BZY75_01110 [SAR202 cluster bacterium Io17-Chloro-G7]